MSEEQHHKKKEEYRFKQELWRIRTLEIGGTLIFREKNLIISLI